MVFGQRPTWGNLGAVKYIYIYNCHIQAEPACIASYTTFSPARHSLCPKRHVSRLFSSSLFLAQPAGRAAHAVRSSLNQILLLFFLYDDETSSERLK